MGYNQEKAVSVCINGEKLSNVVSVVSTFLREKTVTDGVLQKTGADMRVVIRREKQIGTANNDSVNLRGCEGFRLDIYTPYHVSTYTSCQWLEFKEEILTDNKIVETMTVASLSCTQVT